MYKLLITSLVTGLLSLNATCLANSTQGAKELALLDMTLLAFTRSSSEQHAEFYTQLADERVKTLQSLEENDDAVLQAELEKRKALLTMLSKVVYHQNTENNDATAAIILIDDLLAFIPEERRDGRALALIREEMWTKMLESSKTQANLFLVDNLNHNEILIRQVFSKEKDGVHLKYLVADLNTKQLQWRKWEFYILPETFNLLGSLSVTFSKEAFPFIIIIKGKDIIQYLKKRSHWLAASQSDIHFILIEEGHSHVELKDYVQSVFQAKTANPSMILAEKNTGKEMVILIHVSSRRQLGNWPLARLGESGFSRKLNQLIIEANRIFD